jgi:hypothetical protein
VEPSAELCDGRDNDCDTDVDEDFPDLMTSCEAGLGICARPGVMVCSDDGARTACTATPGEGFAELCDGLDNDCDGDTDEDFDGLGEACAIGQGECFSTGVTVCGPVGGIACSAPVIDPQEELCDFLDNDCDGGTDENFLWLGLPCTAGAGECVATGHYVCSADGSVAECDATPAQGTDEVCDSLDNDCDGSTDEDWMEDCSTTCGSGYRFCVGGSPGPCSAPQPAANDSNCNYLDDDCDGLTDEDVSNLGQTCEAGVGGCRSLGYYICAANGGTRCNAVAGTPQAEGSGDGDTCSDGVDNDCNGQTDGDDSDCDCKNVAMKDLMPLHIVGGGLGVVIAGRRKRRKREREDQGGAS